MACRGAITLPQRPGRSKSLGPPVNYPDWALAGSVGEAWGAWFWRELDAVRREADGVIPAAEHQQVEQLLLAPPWASETICGSALEPLNAWAGRWSDSQQQAHREKGADP